MKLVNAFVDIQSKINDPSYQLLKLTLYYNIGARLSLKDL